AVTYFAYAAVRLLRMLALGKSDNRFDHPWLRLKKVVTNVVLQVPTFRKPLVGLMHFMIVWAFLVFSVNTINHFVGGFVEGYSFFFGTKLDAYYATVADVFAILLFIGVLGLAFRRYIIGPECLTKPSPESAVVLISLGGVAVTYLVVNATEIVLGYGHYAQYKFASSALAGLMDSASEGTLHALLTVSWWSSAIMHLILFALLVIPTKHVHLIAGSFNTFFHRLYPRGRMTKLDLEDEEAETFGVSKIEEFTWKQLLDLYSCIECGRCQENCPAYASDKPLNPRELIRDLKHHLFKVGPTLLKQRGVAEASENDGDGQRPALIADTIEEDVIWSCTTCAGCVEHCPVMIEHIDKLTDMRRYLVLMESQFPREGVALFKNMETNSNPWGIGWAQRADWAKELGVPTLDEKKETDVLYWVGCSGAYDDRNKKVSQAMVKIFKAAGVDFAILGAEEKCCGDSARRLGNEYLFQTLASTNIETMQQYKFNRIVVACPHGFNTLKHEYPQLGGNYEVVHHTEFILGLIRTGKVRLSSNGSDNVAYHDSCYLGRHNDIYDEPRDILRAAGHVLTPVSRERAYSFCCGAGGGRMWLEENIGTRINEMRTKEIIDTDVGLVATACPFCLTMIEDGMKELGKAETVRTKDIAEIVAEKLAEKKGD
ncbi:MAG: (Fe-S)-binding protein, partial [Candidatus Hydrogenedentes bacterium]|nr:(Fe-S)-binding protein [Candidatus Hydrogenedentota bacterium]